MLKLAKNDFRLIKAPKVLSSDIVHGRRASTTDEVAKLIETAENGRTWRGISGRERALIYRLAVESGLRFNEIKTLLVSDFDFKNGTVSISDFNEKARRGTVLPLRQSTAVMIEAFLRNKTPQSTAFTLKKGYLMIKADLKAAGIPYEVDGLFADFHALRHTATSLLVQTGANPKIIQTLMRHKDINLTLGKYTHLYAGQQRETIESLPNFEVKVKQKSKTGTDDCVGNWSKENCPKSANQSEKIRTISNNSCKGEALGTDSFNAVNCNKTASSSGEYRPQFSGKKSGREDSNLRPLRPERSALAKLSYAPKKL
jgi:hypothetical protein